MRNPNKREFSLDIIDAIKYAHNPSINNVFTTQRDLDYYVIQGYVDCSGRPPTNTTVQRNLLVIAAGNGFEYGDIACDRGTNSGNMYAIPKKTGRVIIPVTTEASENYFLAFKEYVFDGTRFNRLDSVIVPMLSNPNEDDLVVGTWCSLLLNTDDETEGTVGVYNSAYDKPPYGKVLAVSGKNVLVHISGILYDTVGDSDASPYLAGKFVFVDGSNSLVLNHTENSSMYPIGYILRQINNTTYEICINQFDTRINPANFYNSVQYEPKGILNPSDISFTVDGTEITVDSLSGKIKYVHKGAYKEMPTPFILNLGVDTGYFLLCINQNDVANLRPTTIYDSEVWLQETIMFGVVYYDGVTATAELFASTSKMLSASRGLLYDCVGSQCRIGNDFVLTFDGLSFAITPGVLIKGDYRYEITSKVTCEIVSTDLLHIQKESSSTLHKEIDSTLCYNPLGSVSKVSTASNKYVPYWVLATNCSLFPIHSVMGQEEYDTLAEAAISTFSEESLPHAPSWVYKILYKVIFLNDIVAGISVAKVIDLRSTTDKRMSHFNLDNYLDDVHPQYAKTTQLVYEKPANQAAATFTSMDDVKNKLFFGYDPIVNATPTMADFASVKCKKVRIVGDTRKLSGLCFTHCPTASTVIPHWSTATGAGSGTMTLSAVDYTLTVVGSISNPDFSDRVAGDKCLITDTSKVLHLMTIASVSGNTITFNELVPTVNGYAANLILLPNVEITEDFELEFSDVHIELAGFYFTGVVFVNSKVSFESCVINNGEDNALLSYSEADVTFIDYETTIVSTLTCGILAITGKYKGAFTVVCATSVVPSWAALFMRGTKIDCDKSRVMNSAKYGIYNETNGTATLYNAYATKCVSYGITAAQCGCNFADRSYTCYCGTGWYASDYGFNRAYEYVSHNNTSNFGSSSGINRY